MGNPLQARVGIASGLVLIGDLVAAGAPHDHDVVGETPNLAARLQANAEPNTVIISGETRRLVGELFECAAVDAQPLKGFAMPMESWRVVKRSEIVNRFQALRSADTLLVGREQETDLMVGGWESAKAGNGRVLLISGEPGIGKSRLVEALLSRLEHEQHVRLRYFCAPNRQDSPLYPVIAQLERAAGITRDDTAGQKLDKLETMLGHATADLAETAPLIAELLSIPTEGRYPPLELTPQKRREKTLQALMAQFEGLARQPILCVVEDVHWIDATSLEISEHGGRSRARNFRSCSLVTFRPEFAPPWVDQPHVTQINLDRLPRERSAELIADLTRDKALPGATVAQIIERTDGIPLFIEELTKVLVERGGARPAAREIPATLRDMLTARLDRMGGAKEVAQIASVIGNEFSARLLSDVAPIGEERLDAELKKLVDAELLFEQGRFSLDKLPVQACADSRCGVPIIGSEPTAGLPPQDRRDAEGAILGRRGDPARDPRAPLRRRGSSRSRNSLISRRQPRNRCGGRRTRKRSPTSPRRRNCSTPAGGSRAPATRACAPACDWHTSHCDQRVRFSRGGKGVCAGSRNLRRWQARRRSFFLFGGDCGSSIPRGPSTGRRSSSPSNAGTWATPRRIRIFSCWPTTLQGSPCRRSDSMPMRCGELEKAIAIHNPERHASTAFAYGQDSGVVCRSQAAFSLWFLGYPDQASRLNEEAVALAERLNHPYSLAAALDFSAWVDQLRGDSEAAQKHAEKAIAISMKHDFVFWLLTGMILHGWALTQQ